MIKWSEQYETGIVLIDQQHQKLFQYLADLENAVSDTDVTDEILTGAFDYFEKYIKIHFSFEESCMYRYQCPIAGTNQTAHRSFIEFFNNYKKLFEQEGASQKLYKEIIDFCEQWILQHICKIDIQLKASKEKA